MLYKCADMAMTKEIVDLILGKSTRANAEKDGQSQQEGNLFTLAIENRFISLLVKKKSRVESVNFKKRQLQH